MEDKLLFPKIYYFTDGCEIFEMKKELVCYRHRDGSSIRSGYPEPLLKGIDLGIKNLFQQVKPHFTLLSIINFSPKISTMIDREQSFLVFIFCFK